MQAYPRSLGDYRPSGYGQEMPSSYGTQNPLYNERNPSYHGPEPWHNDYNSMSRPSYDDRRPSGRHDQSQPNSTRNYPDYGRGSSRLDDDQRSMASSRQPQMGYSQYNGHADPRNTYVEFDPNDFRPISDDGRSTYSREDSRITFTLDHLATFTATQKQPLQTPRECLHRLRKMDSTSGLSAHRMLMKLDKHHLLICKPSNGNVMEKFPLNIIDKPEAFLARDPDEPHNNILVVTVFGVKKLRSPTEMHIFHCLAVSAQEIADELLRLKAGRPLKGDNYDLAPIPPPPDMMTMNNNAHKLVDLPRRDSSVNENVPIDVYTLNHCFDDIEKFIAKMHLITAAYKELKLRHQGRNSRTFTHGDGILALRCAPPPEEDFIDIFRKYKLTFNLLGKLKSELKDPNAAELVHFIFTPLALIVQASIDSSGGENLAGSIVTPLMTELAVDLLSNCLSSKESVMWHSLGEAWTVPRYGRSPSLIPYNPIFYDGWSPGFDYADMDPTTDLSRRPSVAEPERMSPKPMQVNEIEKQYSSIYPKKQSPQPTYQPNYTYDTAISREETQVKQPSPVPTTSRERKICEVTADRVGKNEKELTLIAGELVEVLDDRKNWWKARNSSGDEGYVPCTILKPSSETELYRAWDPPLPTPKRLPPENYEPASPPVSRQPPSPQVSHKSTSTLVSYRTTGTNTIPLLETKSPSPKPAPVVIPVREPPPPQPIVLRSPTARKRSVGTNTTEEEVPVFRSQPKPMTPPPQPPPPPPPHPRQMIEQYQQYSEPELQFPPVLKKSKSQHDLLQDEIQEKLSKGKLNIKRTAPNAYFTARSTPEEVAEWLRAKEFSEDAQYQLRNCNGATLMTMDYPILERHFGRDEGKRLASQIELQKKISGFKTMSSRELEALLQIRLQEIGDTEEP